MIGITLHELTVFPIDVLHQRAVIVVEIVGETDVHLALVEVQAVSQGILHVSVQIGIPSLDLKGVNQLVGGTDVRKRRVVAVGIPLKRGAPMIVKGITEVETRIERPFFILLLSVLMKPRTGSAYTEAVSQLLPFTIVLHITVRNSLTHSGMVEQSSVVKIVRITLRVLDASIQSSTISETLFINAFSDEGIFLPLNGGSIIHYWLIIQELLVLALSSSPHIRTHGIESEELLVLQVALIVNVERRGEV